MMKKLFLPLAALTITACQPEPNVALRIDCGEFNDQGVAITLNGTPIGDCPLDIMTHAGQADISVKKTFADASYLEGTQSVMLAENVNKRVKFELQQIYGENYYYKKITTIADAREYLKRFPQGQYAQQVSEKLEDWFYEKTTDLSGMNEYLKLYPEGRYAPQVAEKKELRYYEGATEISGIEDYIKNYPQGKFISVVKDRQEEYYANKAKTPEGIKDYKERYPEGKFISLMPERLEDYYYSKVISVVSATKYMELYPNGRYYKEVSDKRESLRLINKRYFDNLDGTVTDKKTGLVWMRCSLGQRWDGKTCNGEAKEYKWRDAIKLNHNFAGSTDWRLPTVDELETLVLCSAGRTPSVRPNGEYVRDTNGLCLGDNYQKPTINITAFPNTPDSWYWSSSPYALDSSGAWYVGFYGGGVYGYDKDSYCHVRLVRAGQ
ncbi:Lcl C-terminal domain-containing protein [Vibrio cholerae]